MLELPSEVTLNEHETLSLQVQQGRDDDLPADRLTFELGAGAPAGAVLDPGTGRLTWVTGEGTGPGTHVLVVQVMDSGTPSLSSTGAVRVVVREVNQGAGSGSGSRTHGQRGRQGQLCGHRLGSRSARQPTAVPPWRRGAGGGGP